MTANARGRLVVLLLLAAASEAWGQTSVATSSDHYVLPVAELATTKTYPDLITIANGVLEAQLLPNRGRILSALGPGGSGASVLYQDFDPDPIRVSTGLDRVEFGGYYLSIPWNIRDRQPYDLGYRVVAAGPDRAEVELSGTDILKRLSGLATVIVRSGLPVVEVRVAVKNETATRTASEPEFRDTALFAATSGARLLLPASSVAILDSAGGWAGENGAVVAWSSAFGQWDTIPGRYLARVPVEAGLPCYALLYPSLRLAVLKTWSGGDYFDRVEVEAHGPTYAKTPGIGPYFRVSCVKNGLTLEPQAVSAFRSTFVLLTGVEPGATLADLYQRARVLLSSH